MKKIVIVDFGGQYTHMIARRVRECKVYSEIVHPERFIPDENTAGIIFSGSPKSVTDESITSVKFDISKLNVPLLGICYGHQLIARLYGGKIESHQFREYGNVDILLFQNTGLFAGLDPNQTVWMSHGDSVVQLPDNFEVIASSSSTPVCAFQDASRNIYGVQFHPEVSHTKHGQQILENFINICDIKAEWAVENYIETLLDSIRAESQDKNLLILISGGVDSLVALALCARAVGTERIVALHVDTGLMRYKESEAVMAFLHELGLANAKLIDATEKFLGKLEKVTEPEEKRKIIGAAFVETMHEFLAGHSSELTKWMLVQGTIYPDTIESGGTEFAGAIKTHHNRVPEIEKMIAEGSVIEPLKEFYKDEVRLLGCQLGLPHDLVDRRPFPGPGLGIRILATTGADTLSQEEAMQASFFSKQKGFNSRILPIKSVGVQGDDRTYRHPLLIWQSEESTYPWSKIKSFASLAVNLQSTINRVIWSKYPVKEELIVKPIFIEKASVKLLQLVDNVVAEKTADIADIWQLPVVSLPIFTHDGRQCFVLRPIVSADAMTADVYEMNFSLLEEIITEVQKIAGVGYIFYDVTTKPPATIEWE